MIKEFKEFALKGNMIDMAIGIVIGAAFGSVITGIVDGILSPVIAWLTQGVKLAELSVSLGGLTIVYGLFLDALIKFFLIAFAMFLIVKTMNKLKREPAPADPTTKECIYCKTEIPIAATRCPHCTSQLNEE
jgi:large conductance mechanosensitive channel